MPISCATTIRVRYAEVDRLGSVNSSRYFEWFELARSDLLREAGMPYSTFEERGFFAPVVAAHCRYIEKIGYDELVRIESSASAVSHVRLRFDFRLYRLRDGGESLAALGYTENAVVGPDGRPRKMPAELKALLEKA